MKKTGKSNAPAYLFFMFTMSCTSKALVVTLLITDAFNHGDRHSEEMGLLL